MKGLPLYVAVPLPTGGGAAVVVEARVVVLVRTVLVGTVLVGRVEVLGGGLEPGMHWE